MDARFVRTTCPVTGLSLLAGGAGPAVVLVHGLGWDGERLWAGQVAALADAGYRVIVPDLRGTGASPPLRDGATVADLAADLAAMLAGVGAPVLVGFSMGAMVVVLAAGQIGARALVLVCGGLTATPAGAAGVEAMLARARAQGAAAFAAEQAGMIFGAAYAARSPAAVAEFIGWRAAMDQASLHAAFRAPRGHDLRDTARALGVPIHLVAAGQDQFLHPADMAVLGRTIGARSLRVISDCGHMAPVEQPAAVNAALLAILEEA